MLVDASGALLADGVNDVHSSSDPIGHAESNAIRAAASAHGPERLRGATLYASGEPCGMCAGAIFWAGIDRLVFALASSRIGAVPENIGDQLVISSREVLATGSRRVIVEGPIPALEPAAFAAFDGFW